MTAASRPDQILIRADPTSADHGRALAAVGGRVVETIVTDEGGAWQRVQLGQGVTVAQAIEILAKHPGIDFAEPDWQLTGQDLSNDTAFLGGLTWGLYGDLSIPANAFGSQAAEVWAGGNIGSSKVAVAVIDSGVDYTHPDLYLNIWLNYGEIPVAFRSALADSDGDGIIGFRDLNHASNSAYVTDFNANGRIDAGDLLQDSRWENGADNDANGYIDDLVGWDFVNNDNNPMDDRGHGTHVAGTIGAIGGNGTGTAGVAWNVQIVPLKFLNSANQGFTSDAIRAVDYFTAAGQASTVIDFVASNNSWGGGGFSQALVDAIVRGAQQDILFVAAAGNNGANNDVSPFYPANYATLSAVGFDAVIAVGAIGSTGLMPSWSNYGQTTVDIAAPGSGVYSTLLGGGYGNMSGTSMATPHVSGAIALFAAAHPNATAAEIRDALLGSAITSSALNDRVATDGRLDAATFVATSVPSDDPVDPTLGVVIQGTALADLINILVTVLGQPLPGAGADTINAGAGNDTLDGGAGADSLVGGTGSDRYYVDDPGDVVLELAGEGNSDSVYTTINYVLPVEVERLTINSGDAVNGTGNALANIIYGGGGDNQLEGLDGNDLMSGNSGADTLLGGAGADTLNGGSGGDSIDGGAGADSISASSGADVIVFRRGEAGGDVLSDFAAGDQIRFIGFAAGSTFVKVSGSTTDWLVTDAVTAVSETIRFSNGYALTSADFQFVGAPAQGVLIVGTAAGEAITPSSTPPNQPLPTAFADTIQAGGGGDTLDGGAGADSLVGGTGDDRYEIDSGDIVLELAGEGDDHVVTALSYTLLAEVERLTLSGGAAVNGTGNGLANVIIGNTGDNSLNGAAGADSLAGGSGLDTLAGGQGADTLDGGVGADSLAGGAESDVYYVDDAGDLIGEAPGEGDDHVFSSVTYTLAAEVERLTLSGGGAIHGTGNGQANVLTGNTGDNSLNGAGGADTLAGGQGADTLDGGAGADSLAGGAGGDIYQIDDAGDLILEAPGEGDDHVFSSVTYTLAAEVERLTLSGGGAINGTGNGLANIIVGGSGDNRLEGAAGNDSLSGLGGLDTLIGGTGGDTLDGGAGADSLAGGADNDVYIVDDAADVVLELAGEGDDLIQSAVSYVAPAEVERLTLTGGGAINATGNGLANVVTGGTGDNSLDGGAGADTLDGGSGNDTLEGGTGADSLIGGAGNDVYLIDDAADAVFEFAGGGDDHVFSLVSHALAAEVERLTLTGTGSINGVGNALANLITGGTGDNSLDGGSGADTINAGAGVDTLDGGTGADSLVGGAGSDRYYVDDAGDIILELAGGGTSDSAYVTVNYVLPAEVERLVVNGDGDIGGTGNGLANVMYGAGGDNRLEGLDGNDLISGNSGADTLLGGAGADTLNGGAGGDSIDGGAGADSISASSGADVIVFRRGEAGGDVVGDFAAGDQIRFIGFAAGSTFVKVSGSTTDWLVTDAVTGVSETIRFANAYALSSGDFLFA